MSDWADREAQNLIDRIKGQESSGEALMFVAQYIRVVRQMGVVDGVRSARDALDPPPPTVQGLAHRIIKAAGLS